MPFGVASTVSGQCLEQWLETYLHGICFVYFYDAAFRAFAPDK